MIIGRKLHVLGEARQDLYESALKAEWIESVHIGHRRNLRSALVCLDWPGVELFWDLAGHEVASLAERVSHAAVDLRHHEPIEMQLTWMREGDYFHQHIDNARPEVKRPRVTFVYYLGDNSTFTGGENSLEGMRIEPMDDSLVCYSSDVPHEVLTVYGQDAKRLTINGWSW